jgi:hypothetical protein
MSLPELGRLQALLGPCRVHCAELVGSQRNINVETGDVYINREVFYRNSRHCELQPESSDGYNWTQ